MGYEARLSSGLAPRRDSRTAEAQNGPAMGLVLCQLTLTLDGAPAAQHFRMA
jgi:hypothetical protein